MDSIIDLIYEAAVSPERWTEVLGRIAAVAECDGANLFNLVDQAASHVSSFALQEIAAEYLAQDWPEHTDRAQRVLQKPLTAFVTDLDVYSRDELRCEPVYQEFLLPRGLGWGAAAGFKAPTGDLVVVDVQRRWSDGPVPPAILRKLNVLRPHIGRAALLSGRIAEGAFSASTAAFEALGLAAAAVQANGYVVSMNSQMQSLSPTLLRDGENGLRFRDVQVDTLYRQALAAIVSGSRELLKPIPLGSSEPKQVIYLLPVRRSARDLFVGAAAFLVLLPIQATGVLPLQVVQTLYSLTPAEARTACEIASGYRPEEVAKKFDLSLETIRGQLKAVFAKTGARRQIDLVTLLAGPAFVREEVGRL